MLDAIQKFSNSDIFSVTLENEPEKTKYWFRATDLCELLFSKNNAHKYVTTHCKDWQYREFQVGNGRPALYVCESGVYRLLLRSKAPIAVEFQDWLTEEVLPKLRASGGYIMPTATSDQLEALKVDLEKRIAESKEMFDLYSRRYGVLKSDADYYERLYEESMAERSALRKAISDINYRYEVVKKYDKHPYFTGFRSIEIPKESE